MAESEDQTPQRIHHGFGDSISLGGVALTVILWAIFPTVIVRAVAMLIGASLLAYLGYRSHFVRTLSAKKKHIIAGAIVLVLIVIAVMQLLPQWKREHPTVQAAQKRSTPQQPQTGPTPANQSTPTPATPTIDARARHRTVTLPPAPNVTPAPPTSSPTIPSPFIAAAQAPPGLVPVPACPADHAIFTASGNYVGGNGQSTAATLGEVPEGYCIFLNGNWFINAGPAVKVIPSTGARAQPSPIPAGYVPVSKCPPGHSTLTLSHNTSAGNSMGMARVPEGWCVIVDNNLLWNAGTPAKVGPPEASQAPAPE